MPVIEGCLAGLDVNVTVCRLGDGSILKGGQAVPGTLLIYS